MSKCTKCGFVNKDHYLFCMECGETLPKSSGSGGSQDEIATVLSKQDDEIATRVASGASEFDLSSASSRSDSDRVPKTRIARVCAYCNNVLNDKALFCHHCGKKAEEATMSIEQGDDGGKTRLFVADETRINPQLIHIKDDQDEGDVFDITKKRTLLGRNAVDITFPTDTYLSPEHCEFTFEGGKLYLKDLNSFNGIFLKLTDKKELSSGGYILIGQQLLQFFPFNPGDLKVPPMPETEEIINFYGVSNKKIVAMIKQIFSDRSEGNRYFLSKESFSIGREKGDIIFPEDKFMSNNHAIISYENDEFYIEDNNSSNGIFLQIHDKTELKDKDYLLIGKQLFIYRAPTEE